MRRFTILSIIFCLIFCCDGYKILAIFPMAMRSHYILGSRIFKELASRGHEMTVISPYPQKNPIKNYRDVSVEPLIAKINERKKMFYSLEEQSVFENMHFFAQMGCILAENVLKNENVQELLHSDEKFDLVIVSQYVNEALLGIAHHFKAPSILISTMPLFSWASFYLAHPAPSSYVPNLISPNPPRMNFWQRFSNTLYDFYSIFYHQWVVLPKHKELVKKYVPGEPDLYEFINNASLILLNSDVSSCYAMPQVPNAIEIGGAHIDEPKKLPDDLQKFLDNSTNGVILFSLGSNLRSSDLSDTEKRAILGAFSKLKENVLCKWEKDTLPEIPKNVKLAEWLPQSDILAHPNVKALISHGGLLSTQESIYHGIPLIGIPVYVDQKMNMARVVADGYGILIPLQQLTEEKLSWALNELINNTKYKNNAQTRSRIMKDRPIKPLDHAVYWIEYVIRHQGAPHLRYPGMEMNWFQRNLIDVLAVMAALVNVSILAIFFIIKQILKTFKTDYKREKRD